MPSTPLICCSIGVDTDSCTVTASAPTYVAVNWISGGAMSGYCEIGRLTIATMPMRVIMIEMTIATIGRSMKNRAIPQRPWVELGAGAAFGVGVGAGFAITFVPPRMSWSPCTTTRSPAARPFSITHPVP